MFPIGLQELGKVDIYSELGRQSGEFFCFVLFFSRNLRRGMNGCKLASLAHGGGKCRDGVCVGGNFFAQPSWRMEV